MHRLGWLAIGASFLSTLLLPTRLLANPRLLLVADAEVDAARAALEARGARVTHLLPGGRLLVDLPDGLQPELVWPRLTSVAYRPLQVESNDVMEHIDLVEPEHDRAPGGDEVVTASPSPVLVGDVVLALALPESTGALEANLVDWSPADVERAVATVVAGTRRFVDAPGAPRLTFRIHLLDAPPPGGTPGTVACSYEARRHSNFDARTDESWLTQLGYDIGPGVHPARNQLANDLRAQFRADGAVLVKVIHNGNDAPGRASALLGGPQLTWFVGSSPYVAAHELAHAFGALDEYCPDACSSPSRLAGLQGAANANSRGNDGTGYMGGAGEGQDCMMMADRPRICPHTRLQLGWSDQDGDGRTDAEDLFADVTVAPPQPTATGFLLTGSASIAPLLGTQPVRVATVARVEVRVGLGAWQPARAEDGAFDEADEDFSLVLGPLPDGRYTVEVRTRSNADNTLLRPRRHTLVVTGSSVTDASPAAAVTVHPVRAQRGTAVTFDATASSDLEASPLLARYDFDGDDNWDTDWTGLSSQHHFTATGSYLARVQVRDRSGNLALAEVPVEATDEDLPPVLTIAVRPIAVFGQSAPALWVDAASSFDPEGGDLTLEYEFGVLGELVGPTTATSAQAIVDVPLSEAVAVRVTARDPAGNATIVTRSVHVVSYDQPPTAALTVRPAQDPGVYVLDASASSDPDAAELWDGMLAFRYDFDGDGIFDTPFVDGQSSLEVSLEFDQAYAPVVEVRDRLFAVSRADASLDLRPAPSFDGGVDLEADVASCGITLSWNEASAGADAVTYALYRRDNAGDEDAWQLLANVATRRYLDTTARAGAAYDYLVRAWAPGEPPLEDGNVEMVSATRPASDLTLLATRSGAAAIVQWTPGVAATVLAATRRGAEPRSVGSGTGNAVVAGADRLQLLSLTPDECVTQLAALP